VSDKVSTFVDILFLSLSVGVFVLLAHVLVVLDDPICTIVQVGTENGSYEKEVCK
jgi:hypothetical protein